MLHKTESKPRLALPGDEAEIIMLVRMMHAESGLFSLSEDRVRETLSRAWNRKGSILAVIGSPGNIRAMLCVEFARSWYTDDDHLEEKFCWVHPDHRQSDYSKLLIEEAKRYSDDISARSKARGGPLIPLLMGVLTSRRMAPKVRLYRRFFGIPVGAFFVHNATWVSKDDVSEEDFWRLPNMAKWLRRRTERDDRKRERVGA